MTAVKHLRGSPSARPTIATGRRASTRGFDVRAAKTFVRGFEKAAAPLDVDELVLLREIVYHVVKAEYWGMIEEGSLPRRSRAAFKLIESADSGLDDTRTPLHDFDLLHAAIAKSTAATWLDRFFNCLDSCLPECVTIDNRIHYALAYDRRPRADVERRLGVFLARRATIRPLGISTWQPRGVAATRPPTAFRKFGDLRRDLRVHAVGIPAQATRRRTTRRARSSRRTATRSTRSRSSSVGRARRATRRRRTRRPSSSSSRRGSARRPKDASRA